MRKTHEPQAAVKALIAALGVSTMVLATTPAHAGPLGFLKKTAEKELKKAAQERLSAEADKGGVLGLAAGAAMDRTGMEPVAAGDEHEVEYDIAAGALKLVQNGTTVETADEVLAGSQETQQVGRGRTRARATVDSAAMAADAEPQDAFMYFDTSTGTAKGKVEASWKVEEGTKYAGEATDESHKDWVIIESMSGGSGFRGGVFVASGDVNGDGRDDIIVGPGLCKLVQNGTTVATAEDILANLSDEEEALWARAKSTHNMTATCAKLVQNGTTVATANEILSQHREEPVALLLPAVQAFRATARPARAGMSQNGTRVPSADTVRAPEDGETAASPYLHIEGVKGESKD